MPRTGPNIRPAHNLLQLVERTTAGLNRGWEGRASDTGLRIRAHCVAARALTLHQAGDKASNLEQAAQHLAAADTLGAGATEPARLAAALLNFVRAARPAR